MNTYLKNSSQKIMPLISMISLVCFITLGSCDGRKKEEIKQMERHNMEVEMEKRIIEMAENYNAVIDWEKDFRLKDFDEVYTFEVQDALVREDEKPIMFISSIKDIERTDTEYKVYFYKGFEHFGEEANTGISVLFILNCTIELVQKVLSHSEESIFENYSVIASISEVNKVRFSLTPYSLGDYEAIIEIDSNGIIVAKGECMDLMFVADYGLSETQKLFIDVFK